MEGAELIRLEKATMSVPEMRKMLGLGKTDSYWILKQREIETVILYGKIRIVKDSFEKWYANQVKYRKVNGDPPGALLNAASFSVRDLAALLNVNKATIYYHIQNGDFETFQCDHWTRVTKESFERWYAAQEKHHKPEERRQVEEQLAVSYSIPDIGRLLGIDRNKARTLIISPKNRGTFEVLPVAGQYRVTKESFEKWYGSQNEYHKVSTAEAKPKQRKQVKKKPPMPDDNKYVRIQEAALLLDMDPRKLYRLVITLQVFGRKLGTAYMIPGSEIKRLIEERSNDEDGNNQAEE